MELFKNELFKLFSVRNECDAVVILDVDMNHAKVITHVYYTNEKPWGKGTASRVEQSFKGKNAEEGAKAYFDRFCKTDLMEMIRFRKKSKEAHEV